MWVEVWRTIVFCTWVAGKGISPSKKSILEVHGVRSTWHLSYWARTLQSAQDLLTMAISGYGIWTAGGKSTIVGIK